MAIAEIYVCVNLKIPVNKQTVPTAWPMPHIESELSTVSGSKCFATFDLSDGYWQLALDLSFQECQSFITPDGIYSPTRVLHGTRNAVSHLQSCMQEILKPLRGSLLARLDYIMLYVADELYLLSRLRVLSQICRDRRIKLHPGKCELFSMEVRWCGLLITGLGASFDPRRGQGLRAMGTPKYGSELQQFLCAMNWMRTGTPGYSTMIAPLLALMEVIYETMGERGRSMQCLK
jgi:Reverse transcriptase (RNA-dependent DNA polymerase)